MQSKAQNLIVLLVLILLLIFPACSMSQPPTPTNTPAPTATKAATPTYTPKPSRTPTPTLTPDIAATEHTAAQQAEVQKYFEAGYLTTTDGRLMEYDDFEAERAELTAYRSWVFYEKVNDFYLRGHFKWSSAYQSANTSGCGFVFGIQENGDHFAVFLDRSKVLFVQTKNHFYRSVGLTHGTGRVKFDNPFDHPVEADFTLIVKDAYAYILVNDEVVSEYTLSQSNNSPGNYGVALLSGTNKDFGTRCEITNLHAWIPQKE